jgi:histidine triad (HIT) family protein
MEGCIFCQITEGKIPVEKIYENDNFYSIPDRNPVVDGHSLVISKKHFGNILDLPSSLGSECLDCVKKTALKLMKEKKASGFNVVNNNFSSAGQIVEHTHIHILPRKEGDGVKGFE